MFRFGGSHKPSRSRERSGSAVRAWPRWSDMRPLLLRSAGVVGLAGAIVAMISNEHLFVRQEPQPARQASPAVAQQDAGEATIVAVGSLAEETAFDRPANLLAPPSGMSESAEDMARLVQAAAQFAAARSAAAAQPSEISESAKDMARLVQAAAQSAAAQSAAAAQPAAAVEPPAAIQTAAAAAPAAEPAPPAAPAAEAMAAAAAESDPGNPPAAAECPRDWIKPGGETLAGCGEAAALIDFAAVPADRLALEEAALRRASELAGLQFAPRIPAARPEPPKNAIKKVAATRKRSSSWPAGPPPNCGTKHAYWRFIDRKAGTKEWYCK